MEMKILLCFLALSCLSLSLAEDVKITVKGVTSIARTDDNFICATLDWWPVNKCDYGQCPWGLAGLFNLDLSNPILSNAIKAFNPLRIRLGGSLQDQIIYKIGNASKKCPTMKKQSDGMFGFSKGCLTMQRWDALNHLFNDTGAVITFGLNALAGRKRAQDDHNHFSGDWDSQNTRDFMQYTISKGYKIDSYELGNELSGSGVSGRIDADQYGRDMIALKELVKELYPDPASRPGVLGPAGFYDQEWYETFLQVSGPNVVDGVTQHTYNLGAGVDATLINKVRDPYFLSQVTQTYKDMSKTIARFSPWAGAWVGEAGGAYNSGGKYVSHTFANGFWYVDQLGMTSEFEHKVFCRQALIGGNYALLNTTTFIPNPDYYSALLWHRLMGKEVLSTRHNGSPFLRVYSHCSRDKPGVAMVLINMSNSTSFDISIVDELNFYPKSYEDESAAGLYREEYHLTPEGGNIQSDVLLLNGTPLKLTESSDIPELKPKLVDPYLPVHVAHDSIVFVTLKGFKAPACA